MDDNNFHGADRLLDDGYFGSINEGLLQEVRPQDRTILDIACGDGRFGHRIKHMRPDAVVTGIVADAAMAPHAREVLDAVHILDIENELPPIEPGSIDCIVLDGILQTMRDPASVLRKLVPLLTPQGRFIAAVENAQHFDSLASLIAGDIQVHEEGPLKRDTVHLFGTANIQKLFLDAGLMPQFTNAERDEIPPGMAEAIAPIAQHLKLNVNFLLQKMQTRSYVCTGRPMVKAQASERGITFVAAVNNLRQLQDNLLASPIFRNGRHDVIPVTGATSAADALRTGLGRAAQVKDVIVLLHQDIYLPEGWDDKLIAGIDAAEQAFGPVGIAGVFGVVQAGPEKFERAGKVLDRRNTLETPHALPARAVSLDEIVLAFPVRNGGIAGLEPELGFHMYGSEVCLKVGDAGEEAIIVDAPCLHNSESSYNLDQAFARSAQIFADKRRASFPYATTCVEFHTDGQVRTW